MAGIGAGVVVGLGVGVGVVCASEKEFMDTSIVKTKTATTVSAVTKSFILIFPHFLNGSRNE